MWGSFMLDINYVRSNLDLVKRKLEERNFPPDALETFASLDQRRRSLVGERDDLNARRNRESQEIGKLMKEGLKQDAESRRLQVRDIGARISVVEADLSEIERELNSLMVGIPNLPHESVPVGADESANREIRRWGTPRRFSFEPRDHVELGALLGILDTQSAVRMSGARFAVLKGAGARLERALINFCLDLHTRVHGYLEIVPPFIVNGGALFGTGQLPKFEQDLFKLQDDRNLYLIPTAEVPLANIEAGEILDGARLPISMVAYSPCFRSEAGSYGKDTKGLIRQHQFEKVELVKITKPEQSYDELESLTAHAESLLQLLGLPYRAVALSTGDLGFGSAKTYDLEVWLPSQNTYREISSCSNCEAFQARRAQIRFKRESDSKPEYAHTLNGSGLAIGRTWLAVLENYQQEDGSVLIPEALRPFMGDMDAIHPQGG
jgi:seryl-tRNA synthetase